MEWVGLLDIMYLQKKEDRLAKITFLEMDTSGQLPHFNYIIISYNFKGDKIQIQCC